MSNFNRMPVSGNLRTGILLAFALSIGCAGNSAIAAGSSPDLKERRHSPTQPLQSREDVERRDRERRSQRESRHNPDYRDLEFRSIDGSNNNPVHPDWGRADIEFSRLTYSDYSDGAGTPSGERRPGPREISNAVIAQSVSIPNTAGASDFVWLWGQFIDHDLDLTPTISPIESFDIRIPTGDPFFDPAGNGEITMPLDRSLYTVTNGIREQLNLITTWIDASMVYGSDAETAALLRTNDGTGRLRTSRGQLLPFDPANPDNFIAGDSRANEHAGLAAMHALFVREHNYWAERLRRENRRLSGEEIYQMARMVIAAQMQIITYREFLPVLLGSNALVPYRGYRRDINPSISNEFATAAFRFGHSMVSPQLMQLDHKLNPVASGHLPLRSAFFNTAAVVGNGIDPMLRGFAMQNAQRVDIHVIDDLRNFLFGPPGGGGFDLPALNIQRGRDHGLPPYNEVRRHLGLTAAGDFTDVSSDPEVQARLASIYASVEEIDLWVGGLAEDHVPGALVGETVFTILKDQFERLRDGDRFWYQIHLSQPLLDELESLTLATIIRRNTGIGDEIQDNVFIVPERKPRQRDHHRSGEKRTSGDRWRNSRR